MQTEAVKGWTLRRDPNFCSSRDRIICCGETRTLLHASPRKSSTRCTTMSKSLSFLSLICRRIIMSWTCKTLTQSRLGWRLLNAWRRFRCTGWLKALSDSLLALQLSTRSILTQCKVFRMLCLLRRSHSLVRSAEKCTQSSAASINWKGNIKRMLTTSVRAQNYQESPSSLLKGLWALEMPKCIEMLQHATVREANKLVSIYLITNPSLAYVSVTKVVLEVKAMEPCLGWPATFFCHVRAFN